MVVRVTQERACRGVRARRTAAVDVADDGSAFVSECFHFRLRADELHTTSVTIQALQPHSVYAKGEWEMIFFVIIGDLFYASRIRRAPAAFTASAIHFVEDF